MKIKTVFSLNSSIALLVIFVVNCASTTLIKTNDRDVKIYADGEYLGKGEAQYTSTKSVFASTKLEFEKDGCQSMTYSLSKDGGLHGGACVGGLFFLIPFFWITEYRSVYSYNFRCRKK